MAFLKVFEGGDERTAFLGSAPMIVGRGDDADIFIKDRKASRRHCVIEPTETGWKVRDLGSGNGTRVNDEPISEHTLRPDDVVQIGDARLLFAGEAVQVVETAAAASPRRVRAETREDAPRRSGRPKSKLPWIIGAAALAGAAVLIVVFGAGSGNGSGAGVRDAEGRAYRAVVQAATPESRLERAKSYLSRFSGSGRAAAVREIEREARLKLHRGEPASSALDRIEAEIKNLDPAAALIRLDEMLAQAPREERETIRYVRSRAEKQLEAKREGLFRMLEEDFDRLVAERQYARAKESWFFLRGEWPRIPESFQMRIVQALDRMETAASAERGELLENVTRAEAAHDFKRAEELLVGNLPRFTGTSVLSSLKERLEYVRRAEREGVSGRPTHAPTAVSVDIERELTRILLRTEKREFEGASRDLRALADTVRDKRARKEILLRAAECDAAAGLFASLRKGLADKAPGKLLKVGKARYKVVRGGADGVTIRVKGKEQTYAWPRLPSDLFVALLAIEMENVPRGALGLAVAAQATGREELLLQAVTLGYALEGAKPALDRFLAARVRKEPLPEGGYVVHEGDLLTRKEQVRRIEEATIQRYEALLEASAEKIRVAKVFRRLDRMYGRKDKLDEARDHAKQLIYDEQRYFYPYRGTGRMAEYNDVQKEVDLRVDVVRTFWEDRATATFKMSADLKREVKKFDEAVAELEKRLVDVSKTKEQIAYLRSYLGKSFNVRTFYRDDKERDLIEYSDEVMAFNAKVEGDITDIEREQVRVTNIYRIMFGHWPVRLAPKLVLAARGHCEEMSRLGYFSHFSKTKGRERPGDRMRLAGYKYGVSENIIAGRTDPKSAHYGWAHSSGHHRNLLMSAWTEMGTGHHGRNMCQNFGQAPRYSERWKQEPAEGLEPCGPEDDDETDEGVEDGGWDDQDDDSEIEGPRDTPPGEAKKDDD